MLNVYVCSVCVVACMRPRLQRQLGAWLVRKQHVSSSLSPGHRVQERDSERKARLSEVNGMTLVLPGIYFRRLCDVLIAGHELTLLPTTSCTYKCTAILSIITLVCRR